MEENRECRKSELVGQRDIEANSIGYCLLTHKTQSIRVYSDYLLYKPLKTSAIENEKSVE